MVAHTLTVLRQEYYPDFKPNLGHTVRSCVNKQTKTQKTFNLQHFNFDFNMSVYISFGAV
jgi:hypothetical protein